MDDKYIISEIEKDKKNFISQRRHLHTIAELSSKEFKTSAYLKNEVKKLGLEIFEVEGTGFYAILDTHRPGKTIGLRTDIDALPVKEAKKNLSCVREILSEDGEVFHACGHDGHMAIILSTMRILVKNKDKLNGKLVFIFEEAEETGASIGRMIESLKKENIDYFYGNHLTSFLNTGEIALDAGPVMAGFAMVDFTIRGVGGHSSRPDKAISPIFCQAAVIQSLASAFVNRLDPDKSVTLGLSTIHGGKARNVIADEVGITGTLRFFDIQEVDKAIDVIKLVGTNVAKAHGCEFIVNKLAVENNPVINDARLSAIMTEELENNFATNIKKGITWYASESFEAYGKLGPSLFAFVGIKNDKKGTGAEHHTPYFDIDEDSLAYGIFAMVKFVNAIYNR